MEQFSETQCTCLLACNTHLLTVEILSERIISLSSITTCTHRLQGVLIVGILHVLKYLLFIIIIRKQKGVIQTNRQTQWRSQRGGGFVGSNPPIRIEAVFFTAVKSLLLNIITSL